MTDSEKAAEEIIEMLTGGDDIDGYIEATRLHIDKDPEGKAIWKPNPEAIALIASVIDKHLC